MTESDRQLLWNLRRALLDLYKTLLEWECAAYERVHGRASGGELLEVLVADPQFAWLRPVSELIVRIDAALEAEAPDGPVDVGAILDRAAGSSRRPRPAGMPSAAWPRCRTVRMPCLRTAA